MDELIERLRRKGYRREIWHEPAGTMDVACDADDDGAEAYDINPDGPAAIAALTTLQSEIDTFRRERDDAIETLRRERDEWDAWVESCT